jgi:hypothetical protein
MKLMFCHRCSSLTTLSHISTWCKCGKSYGRFVNHNDAEIHGPCIPLSISNGSLRDAVMHRLETGEGSEVTAWIPGKGTGPIKEEDPSSWE